MLSETNNATHAKDIDLLSQENQEYYHQSDQQFIACKHDGGMKRFTIELVPNIVMEEEKIGFYQWADKYDQRDNNPYTTTEGNEMGNPTHLMLNTVLSTLPKPSITGN